ncbi:MAG: hypothetical protein ACOCUU_01480 [Nanoarchaeota archaeon]
MEKRGKKCCFRFNKKAQMIVTNKFMDWMLWILFFIAAVFGIFLLIKSYGI